MLDERLQVTVRALASAGAAFYIPLGKLVKLASEVVQSKKVTLNCHF
jgi:hypothetical protein